MALDLEHNLEQHRGTWLGFARLMRWALAVIVIVLIGLAAFVA